MTTITNIAAQVEDYITNSGFSVSDFDINGIARELFDMDIDSIDEVDADDFNEIVQRYDMSE